MASRNIQLSEKTSINTYLSKEDEEERMVQIVRQPTERIPRKRWMTFTTSEWGTITKVCEQLDFDIDDKIEIFTELALQTCVFNEERYACFIHRDTTGWYSRINLNRDEFKALVSNLPSLKEVCNPSGLVLRTPTLTPLVQRCKWTIMRVFNDKKLQTAKDWSFLYSSCTRKGLEALDKYKRQNPCASSDVYMAPVFKRHRMPTPEELRKLVYVFLLKQEMLRITSLHCYACQSKPDNEDDHKAPGGCKYPLTPILACDQRYLDAKPTVSNTDMYKLLHLVCDELHIPPSPLFSDTTMWCDVSDASVYAFSENEDDSYYELFDYLWS